MFRQLKNPKLYLMLAADSVAFALALILAAAFRFEFVLDLETINWILTDLAFMIPLKVFLFLIFGLYTGMWRYSSLRDLWRMAYASGLAMVCSWSIIHFAGVGHIPRSVLLMDGVLTFIGPGIIRICIRQWFATWRGLRFKNIWESRPGKTSNSTKKVVIIGAGDAGQTILREIETNLQGSYSAVGLVDDDVTKSGRQLRGVRVLGPVDDLQEICRKLDVAEVIIAVPSASAHQMRRFVDHCESTNLPFRTLPGIAALIDGRATVADLREVNYTDLLGRPQISLESEKIKNYLTGKRILITGCGGSIGSELVRKVASFKPGKLILMDCSELNLFNIINEISTSPDPAHIESILGRIQTKELVEHIFTKHRPEVVFHAAAYKHVHMVEQHPWEAVFNNIVGSRVVMEAAYRHQVDRFVLVSTDKAVRPTSVMGASKRVAELIMQAMPKSQTKFMAVRFGNVIGSSGSVMPLFRKQIRDGGPVTVTHPKATRFFMTIPEAASLILQAGALGEGGEIFVLEMGTPVKIVDMARDLIRLSGKLPDVDIDIVFTGLRPGEKVEEELITYDEEVMPTSHGNIMILKTSVQNGSTGLDIETLQDLDLNNNLEELTKSAQTYSAPPILKVIQTLVPEYKPYKAAD